MPGSEGATVSTHVLNSAEGGGRPGVLVELVDGEGVVVASGSTDSTGRIASLGQGLAPGRYTVRWQVDGPFVVDIAVTVDLTGAQHYHVPLIASGFSATVYLGA